MLLFEQINGLKAFSPEVAAVAMPLLQLHGVGKDPSWHLTSQEALKFIKDSHDRTQEKERKEQEKAKITKEALKKAHATKKTRNK